MADWQPYWLPNHAYALGAVVVPTDTNYKTGVFDGYTWRATTAGTSAGTEPTWPTNPTVTPTINDGGTLVWSVGTGFRQAIQAGLSGIVTTFAQANPTIIRQIRTVRPKTFTTAALPCFFIGDLNETIATANGIRTRQVTGFSAYLVDILGEQIESNDRFNFAVDALTDLFTANFHAISGRSNFQHTATLDTEFEEGGVIFPAAEFQFGQTSVAEGRN